MSECSCIREINEKMSEYNAEIFVNLFGPPRAFIETHTHREIRGKKTPLVQASFCPFCGTKYSSTQ